MYTDIYHDAGSTYPEGFLELFGSGKDFRLDEEPEELSLDKEEIVL